MSESPVKGGAALKGLRLLTVDRGPEGFGFHMYTNRALKGQYVKWVSPNGPAELAGLLPGDHILEVDGCNVLEETHNKVVERIRSGDGKGKLLLVVDRETEEEMLKKGEEMDASKALVMISRSSIEPLLQEGDNGGNEVTKTQPSLPTDSNGVEETDGPFFLDMSAAIPPKKSTKRAQVKTRDWRSSIQAYNEL